jgi:hypothetical protein
MLMREEKMAKPYDKMNIPWSVKGVSKEARAAGKKAAALEGVTMGEWLSRAIRTAKQDTSVMSANETPVANPGGMVLSTSRDVVKSTGSTEALRRGISDRIAQSEVRIFGLVEPLQEIIQQLSSRIESLVSPTPRPPPGALPPVPVPPRPVRRKTGGD